MTKTLGRVSYTEMTANRDIPLNSALQVIRNDPTALASSPPTPDAVPVKEYGVSKTHSLDGINNAMTALSFIYAYGLYIAVGVLMVMAILLFCLAPRRGK